LIKNGTVPSITSLSPVGPFLSTPSGPRQISSTKQPLLLETTTTPAGPQVQRPDFQVFSFFPTVRPEEDRTGGGGGAPAVAEAARSTTSPFLLDAGSTSLTARAKRPEVVRPGGSTRHQDDRQEAAAGAAEAQQGRFLPAERIPPRSPLQQASRLPPTAFQDLVDEPKEDAELFIFRRPEVDDNIQPTVDTVIGSVSNALFQEGQEADKVSQAGQAGPSQALNNRNFNLEDMFVFRPNNRTPLSRLVQNYDDYADETVGRITVLGQSNSLHEDVSEGGQPTFSFFPAVATLAEPPTKQEIFRPLDSQLPLRSIDNNILLSGSEGGHQLIRFSGGQEAEDQVLGSHVISLGSSAQGESRPLTSLVNSFVEDHRDNFAVVRASTNLTPDLVSTDVLATTTPRYFFIQELYTLQNMEKRVFLCIRPGLG
jgi:hypothetical protein